jgi:ABC-2 type transport system ATP-binding protein
MTTPRAQAGRREPGEPRYAVEIEGLSTWYGRAPAVQNLSMHVPHGSIYGLVGPNGAGKTTTMRIVATLQKPGAGTVLVDGIDVEADPAAVRARIGYLPDFFGVYDSLTVTEYLDFAGAIYEIPPRRRKQLVDELLELVGLTERRSAPLKSLSRSMRQQLALARCLIHDPRILLLDEPAAGMDPQARIDLREILLELSRLNKTIVISSHVLDELAEICTHVGIMRGSSEGAGRDGHWQDATSHGSARQSESGNPAPALLVEGPVDETIGMVAPGVRLRIRLFENGGGSARALRILAANPACRVDGDPDEVAAATPSEVQAQFYGEERDLAAILSQLEDAGLEVIEFAVERPTLEDVFLEMMASSPSELSPHPRPLSQAGRGVGGEGTTEDKQA